MNTYPIRLESLNFIRTHVEAMPGFKFDGAVAMLPQTALQSGPVSDLPAPAASGRFQAVMEVHVNADRLTTFPYLIDMACLAVFEVDGSLSLDEAMRGVAINANSVMFGAVREMVASLTGRLQPTSDRPGGESGLPLRDIETPADH